MSGRIRTLKPELLEDAVTAGLSDTAFRLFVACILMADDYGVFRAEPSLLEGHVYWKATPSTPLADAMIELRSLVLFYETEGQQYAHIRNWDKHQKVSHPGRRRLPPPPSSIESRETLPKVSRVSREPLAKPSGNSPETLPITSTQTESLENDATPEGLPKSSGESRESLRFDLRPSTIDHRPGIGREPKPSGDETPKDTATGIQPDRKVHMGTAPAEELRITYELSMASALGHPFGLDHFGRRDVVDLANVHGPPGLAPKITWLKKQLPLFVESVRDTEDAGGYKPRAMLNWLNAGGGKAPARTPAKAEDEEAGMVFVPPPKDGVNALDDLIKSEKQREDIPIAKGGSR